ncbi:MAG TPA: hypothetical protein VG454_09770 [Gemmatimonadales bacterium]|nr:hypothetical protein [Gemmatimonadales bacterium]
MRPSRVVFAATMIGLGVLGLISRDFPPVWTGVPKTLPGREALVYLCAFVSLATGVGMLVQRTAAFAAGALLIYLLAWLLVFRIYHVVLAPGVEATWWECGDTAVMAAAAWVLYAWFAGSRETGRLSFATGESGLRIARVFYGLGLLPFGIAHFTYLQVTVADVPGWMPWHVAWAYITGAAFIAAGVAVLTGVYARLAAVLSAWMMGLFTLLVWVPIVVAGPNASQWAEFVNSWSLTAAAWVVAESYRGTAWRALRRPSLVAIEG